MTIFTKYPKIIYNNKTVTDLTIRIDITKIVKDNINLSEPYIIQDGDKLETLSYQIYGSVDHYWIISYMNDIIDPFYDWPLVEKMLELYVTNKYGVGNRDVIHHYELDGDTVPSTELGAVPITNFQLEERINEGNRIINLLKPEYLTQLLNEVDNLLETL